jgi:hypothetical protein
MMRNMMRKMMMNMMRKMMMNMMRNIDEANEAPLKEMI